MFRGTRWLNFWIVGVIPGFIGLNWLQAFAQSKITDGAYALVGAKSVLFLLVSIGLWRRRRWGWYLNWVVMFGLPVYLLLVHLGRLGPDDGIEGAAAATTLGAWLIPNALYFKRRAHVFY